MTLEPWLRMREAISVCLFLEVSSCVSDEEISLTRVGMDMQPVTIPIRNFLTENHRKLAAIPQRPVAMTVPEERLLMTWYEHEVKIWEMDHILDVFERDEMGLGLE